MPSKLLKEYRCGFHLTAKIVAWWWRRHGFETNIEKGFCETPEGKKLLCFILTGTYPKS